MKRFFVAAAIVALLVCVGCAGYGSPAYYRNRQYNNTSYRSTYHSHSGGYGRGGHHGGGGHDHHHHRH